MALVDREVVELGPDAEDAAQDVCRRRLRHAWDPELCEHTDTIQRSSCPLGCTGAQHVPADHHVAEHKQIGRSSSDVAGRCAAHRLCVLAL